MSVVVMGELFEFPMYPGPTSESRSVNAIAIAIWQILYLDTSDEHCERRENDNRGFQRSHQAEELVRPFLIH
jgi:hypothetical protein